jgi:poly-gamma-glutamate capsule biosynthesis protein CapA/YwtB (metallophosphatase superfamily)
VTALALVAATAAGLHAQPHREPGRRPRADTASTVRVCSGGDVTMGTNLDTAWVWTASARAGRRIAAFPDADSVLEPVRRLMSGADVVLLNVEGAIGEGPAPRKCGPNSTACFAFRQPPETAGALRRVGGDSAVVVGNVANNHAGDAGRAGLRETVRRLERAGVEVTGADTLATVVVTASGDTVAFLGFSQWGGPDPRDLRAVRRHVARAAARWPRLVVTMHMGAEGVRAQHTRNVDETFYGVNRGNPVAFAHAAVDAGAGLVVGHSPHVVRAIERYHGGLIFYSLGNLATYGPFSLAEPLNRGMVACTSLDEEGRVVRARVYSTRQRPPGIVSTDPTGRAAELADELGREDFPRTGVRVRPNGHLELGASGSEEEEEPGPGMARDSMPAGGGGSGSPGRPRWSPER